MVGMVFCHAGKTLLFQLPEPTIPTIPTIPVKIDRWISAGPRIHFGSFGSFRPRVGNRFRPQSREPDNLAGVSF